MSKSIKWRVNLVYKEWHRKEIIELLNVLECSILAFKNIYSLTHWAVGGACEDKLYYLSYTLRKWISGNGDNLLDIPIQRLLKYSWQDIMTCFTIMITSGVKSKRCYSRYRKTETKFYLGEKKDSKQKGGKEKKFTLRI